jgi:hypothetical protein
MLLGEATAWPLAVRAQQPATLPIIGFAGGDSPDQWAVLLRAFRLGLKATGFTEGQWRSNIVGPRAATTNCQH